MIAGRRQVARLEAALKGMNLETGEQVFVVDNPLVAASLCTVFLLRTQQSGICCGYRRGHGH